MDTNDICSKTESTHPIFTTDPQRWIDLVYKTVQVKTCDGKYHHGVVYTVDPVSESLALLQFEELTLSSARVILSHAISDIQVGAAVSDELKAKMDMLFRPDWQTEIDESASTKRRDNLKSWLEKNLLPVVYDNAAKTLTVAGVLLINPPYTTDSCISTNEIILERIQNLMRAMPLDDYSDVRDHGKCKEVIG